MARTRKSVPSNSTAVARLSMMALVLSTDSLSARPGAGLADGRAGCALDAGTNTAINEQDSDQLGDCRALPRRFCKWPSRPRNYGLLRAPCCDVISAGGARCAYEQAVCTKMVREGTAHGPDETGGRSAAAAFQMEDNAVATGDFLALVVLDGGLDGMRAAIDLGERHRGAAAAADGLAVHHDLDAVPATQTRRQAQADAHVAAVVANGLIVDGAGDLELRIADRLGLFGLGAGFVQPDRRQTESLQRLQLDLFGLVGGWRLVGVDDVTVGERVLVDLTGLGGAQGQHQRDKNGGLRHFLSIDKALNRHNKSLQKARLGSHSVASRQAPGKHLSRLQSSPATGGGDQLARPPPKGTARGGAGCRMALRRCSVKVTLLLRATTLPAESLTSACTLWVPRSMSDRVMAVLLPPPTDRPSSSTSILSPLLSVGLRLKSMLTLPALSRIDSPLPGRVMRNSL